ncbi:MAG: bifunctional 5,10-methylenetetrahydrofolate dehydrogenase/5,10-methenyltetrahydrofolate cyclohydrolase [Deltaproteobacteria bacterium]|nr:bifunctional 5,10-methylenetetrahydrofolate dehydrogenase/5,10-methenyltetrahydrofolate cyclohydrolase [Deltaproteobacteria bacterium]
MLIDGKLVAERVKGELGARLVALREAHPAVVPGLAIVLVGHHPPSEIYVKKKLDACRKVGIRATLHRFPSDVDQPTLHGQVAMLNADPAVHAILVQLPLPLHLDTKATIDRVDPDKDVDGLHPLNIGRLHSGRAGFIPCTPLGVMRLLAEHSVELKGRHAVVLGRSAIVGRPMSWLLLRAHATVTTCHRHTADTASFARTADVLVTAVGKPGLVTRDWVKPGAVVVDVGINRLPDGRVVGDCDPEVREVARLVTPVPGGVGPMTVAMMLSNVVTAAERFARRAIAG